MQGRFIDGNQLLAQKLGVDHIDEIAGITDAQAFPNDLARVFLTDDTRIIATGEPMIDHIELVPNRDGTVEWYLTNKIPLHSENGDIIGIAGITQNLNTLGESWQPYEEMQDVLEYIENNYQMNIELSELANLMYLSVSQFERKFKKNFAMPPMKFIIRFRIHMACKLLLHSQRTITDIAHACGFCDHSHFSRQFVKIMNKSPGQYRKCFHTDSKLR
jgi:AraC-like DNA-binding protein